MLARVWAPGAAAVEVVLETGAVAMEPTAGGWWVGPDLAPGTDYAFRVDGRGPFPDPRSAWQPAGVHGPSRAFDPDAFAWTDETWEGRDARGAVTYELHVGTFTAAGTLDSAAAELPRLAAIGVEMVELMPLSSFPGERGWGYDGVAPYSVHDAYGGPAALQRFVDAAHRLGLAVCLDVVYNHLGPEGNYLAQFGPYFTDAHHTPWGSAVNLDQEGSPEVRRYLTEAAVRWFRDFHIDCLRLDAVHELRDSSPRHWLADLSVATASLAEEIGRPLSLVAESDLNDDAMVTPVADGGLGMTAQWADDVHHALHAYLTGERHGYYAEFGSIAVLNHVYQHVFWHDGRRSEFRGRDWGRPVGDDVDRRRFVVFASNHDQVGNRALGDRPATRLSPGAQAASLALVLLSPFTPMLFQGEEYGETRPFRFFTDHDEPLGSAVTRGRMAEFAGHGWVDLYGGEPSVPDPQDPATRASSVLEPDAVGPPHDELRAWLAQVMAARPRTLEPGAWERAPVAVVEHASRILEMRGPVRVVANLTDAPALVPGGRVVASFGAVGDAGGELRLAADAVALVAAN